MAKMLFIQRHEWQQLGLMYISGTLKKHGHQTDVVIGSNWKEITEAIERCAPDAVGFSVMSGNHLWGLEIAQKVKTHYPEIKTVFGGPHCTFFPGFIDKEGVDVIVRGEGEEAALELMNCFAEGRDYSHINNISFKRDGKSVANPLGTIGDINDIAFPDRAFYNKYLKKIDMSVMNVLASRGCPFKCAFCFEETQRQLYKGKGKYVRLRTHGNLIQEIHEAIQTGPKFDNIFYVDDIFGMQRDWLQGYLARCKEEVKIPFACLIRTEIIYKEEGFAELLADGGCESVAFGIETGDEGLRNIILKKELTNERIVKVAQALRKSGIRMKTFNIFGSPGETPENAFQTVELNIKIKADYPQSNLFIPFPNTGLTYYAIEKGYLNKDFNVDEIRLDSFIHGILKSPHNQFFERINKVFQTAVLAPFLWPLLKKICLMRWKSRLLDRALDLWFGFVYFLVYLKSSRRNPVKLLIYGLKNFRETLGLNWNYIGKSGSLFGKFLLFFNKTRPGARKAI